MVSKLALVLSYTAVDMNSSTVMSSNSERSLIIS